MFEILFVQKPYVILTFGVGILPEHLVAGIDVDQLVDILILM